MEKIRGFEVAKGFEDKEINLPERKTKYSAGYDIEAAEDVIIPSFKKGINPTEVLHDQNNILSNDKININDMTKQFETIFKDLAENINLEDIENLDGAITFESQEQNPDSDEPSKISGAAIPLGSIFSNMFSNKASKSNSDESEELNDGRRKVKVEKKKNKKFSDI